jgi:ferredoxin
VRVSLSKSQQSFSVLPEQPVLDAALDAGLNLPHSCKGGNCGACRARLLQGAVRYPNGRPLGLSEAEVNEGYILLCQARALSDLAIETLAISTPDTAVIKRLPATTRYFLSQARAGRAAAAGCMRRCSAITSGSMPLTSMPADRPP